MATKGKKTSKPTETEAVVTRIKASDSSRSDKKPKAKKVIVTQTDEASTKNPLVALGRYFKGAWYELRQVRWPDRQSTWSLTVAVLLFTAFFMVLILLLDALFKYIFELILG